MQTVCWLYGSSWSPWTRPLQNSWFPNMSHFFCQKIPADDVAAYNNEMWSVRVDVNILAPKALSQFSNTLVSSNSVNSYFSYPSIQIWIKKARSFNWENIGRLSRLSKRASKSVTLWSENGSLTVQKHGEIFWKQKQETLKVTEQTLQEPLVVWYNCVCAFWI